MAFFTYGTFLGTAVAVRRNDHLCLSAMADAMRGRSRQVIEVVNRSVVLATGLGMVVFGWQNFLSWVQQFPDAFDDADRLSCIGRSRCAGCWWRLFSLEQIVNGARSVGSRRGLGHGRGRGVRSPA